MRHLVLALLTLSACRAGRTAATDNGAGQNLEGTSDSGHKYALIVGGAQAVDEPTDHFGADFVRHVGFALANRYETTVLYGDGLDDLLVQHDSLTRLTSMLGAQPRGFTPATYEQAAADLLEKASGGDELLLTVIAHGYACNESVGEELPGGFCVRSGDNVDYSFDNFQPLLDGTSSRGVKVGLLVMTCDSGYAMRFGSASTCVLSATGHDTSNTIPFLHAFDDTAQTGMTLDAAYAATMPVEPTYDMCDGPYACPGDVDPCECPPADQDTPWLSSQRGGSDAPCAEFKL